MRGEPGDKIDSPVTAIAQKEEQSRRSKLYMLKAAIIADSFKRVFFGKLKLVPRSSWSSDTFTKALPRDDFNKFQAWMGVKAF